MIRHHYFLAGCFVASLVGLPSLWGGESHTLRVLMIACWIASTLSGVFVIVLVRRAHARNS